MLNENKSIKNVNKRKRYKSCFRVSSPLPCRFERHELFTNPFGKTYKHIRTQKHTL